VYFSTEAKDDFQRGPKKRSLACMVKRNDYSLNIYSNESELGLYTVKESVE